MMTLYRVTSQALSKMCKLRNYSQLCREKLLILGQHSPHVQNDHRCKNYSTVSSDQVLPSNAEAAVDIGKGFILINDFISTEEETELYAEVQKHFKKLRYEYTHWDDAIHGFRETEKHAWVEKNQEVIDRIRATAFTDDAIHLPHAHVLDLAKEGYIKPHVDSIRFCGSTIAGISLLSPCVFKLIHTDVPSQFAVCNVERRSLYIMKDVIRYRYTHEVLSNEQSYFGDNYIEKDRRISIICRSEPNVKDTQ